MTFIMPDALHAMENLELGSESTYKKLRVIVKLFAPDITVDDLTFMPNGIEVEGRLRPHHACIELNRPYNMSGARLHSNYPEKDTLSVNGYTADVSLPRPLQDNGKKVVVDYSVTKSSWTSWLCPPPPLTSNEVSLTIGGDAHEHVVHYAKLIIAAKWQYTYSSYQ